MHITFITISPTAFSMAGCTSLSTLDLALEGASPGLVTLPVMVLAMVKQPNWGFGFLLVTDFTDFENSTYNRKIAVPSSLPDTFTVGGRVLRRSQIFSILLKAALLDGYWQALLRFSPRMRAYNYMDERLGVIAQEGVVAMVSFRVKSYRGTIEGFMSHLHVATRAVLGSRSLAAEFSGQGLDTFMRRYMDYIDADLYDRLVAVFPIEKYMRRPMKRERQIGTEQDNGSKDGNQNGREEENQNGNFTDHATANNAAGIEQGKAQVKEKSTDRENSPHLSGVRPVFAHPSHGSMPFLHWRALLPADIALGTSIQTSGFLQSLDPHVFVKPFRRTLKLAPLRFTLTANSTLRACAYVEILSDAEWCAFLGISEIEETIENVLKLTSRLESMKGRILLLVVERRLVSLSHGYSRPYWGLASSLEDLTKQ